LTEFEKALPLAHIVLGVWNMHAIVVVDVAFFSPSRKHPYFCSFLSVGSEEDGSFTSNDETSIVEMGSKHMGLLKQSITHKCPRLIM
jgi:hypothetical protein